MKINAIFCNPNKQGFILDKHLLENTNIKLINTASTGTNHICLPDCKKLGIKVLSLKMIKSLSINYHQLVSYLLLDDISTKKSNF